MMAAPLASPGVNPDTDETVVVPLPPCMNVPPDVVMLKVVARVDALVGSIPASAFAAVDAPFAIAVPPVMVSLPFETVIF